LDAALKKTTIFILLIINISAFSQPDTLWTRIYRGENRAGFEHVIQTHDGGYAFGGWYHHEDERDRNMFIVRTDLNGNELWTNTFGGDRNDEGHFLNQLADGSFLLVGGTNSMGGGSTVGYVVRVDSSGEEIWSNTYGGFGFDYFLCVEITNAGSIYLAGSSSTNEAVNDDFWLVQIDEDGELIRERQYEDERMDYGIGVIVTMDGGFLFWGASRSRELSTTSFRVLRLDPNWDVIWDQFYNITEYTDYCYEAVEIDDGFVLGGFAGRGPGNLESCCLLRIDENGDEIWTRHYGGNHNDECYSLTKTEDGGFVLVGETSSFGEGGTDLYLVRTDSNGEELWSQTYGTRSVETGLSVINTNDGGFLLAGRQSWAGWIVKTTMDLLYWSAFPPDTSLSQGDTLVYALDYFHDYLYPQFKPDSLVTFSVEDGEYTFGTIENDSLTLTADFRGFGLDSLILTVTEVANEDNNAEICLNINVLEVNDVEEEMGKIIREFSILDISPNPFNSTATISYTLPKSDEVRLSIHDIQGREIAVLQNTMQTAGLKKTIWNAGDQPSGLYFCRLESKDKVATTKLMLVK
jgi:hypothetical protein